MMLPEYIFISGTSKGIGHSLVHAFLQEGVKVYGCSRGESSIDHANYTHFICDVANEEQVREVFAKLQKDGVPLQALINNAGIASMNHILTTPGSSVKKIMNTNVLGTFILSREAAKIMMKQKYGRIINFTSVARPLFLEGEAAYAASKAAVENFTVVAAKEFADFGFTVNAIGFTPFETDLIKSVPKEKMDALLNRQAIKRMATFEDILHATKFFLHKESSFITGQIMYLGGVAA